MRCARNSTSAGRARPGAPRRRAASRRPRRARALERGADALGAPGSSVAGVGPRPRPRDRARAGDRRSRRAGSTASSRARLLPSVGCDTAARRRASLIGELEPGPRNSIADVGVRVGHVTVVATGDRRGRGRAHRSRQSCRPSAVRAAPAGTAVLNGAGELTGSLEIRGVGADRHARLPHGDDGRRARLRRRCHGRDGRRSASGRRRRRDPCRRRVRRQLAQRRARRARARPRDVAPGAGRRDGRTVERGRGRRRRGMVASAGRAGSARRADVGDGAPSASSCSRTSARRSSCGRRRPDRAAARSAAPARPEPAGSCIAVVATDAPLEPRSSSGSRGAPGSASPRTGSVAHHGSGEIFVAFATRPSAPFAGPRPRSALPGCRRRDRGGGAVLALGGGRHDRPRRSRLVRALPREQVLELYRGRGL